MSLKFNPPKLAARYALFSYRETESDRGTFKVYNDLGSAKNAARRRVHHSNIKILENVEGDWYVLHEAVKGTEYKDLPWVKEVNIGGWYSRHKDNRAVPMTRDEYADWRIAVERERWEAENKGLASSIKVQ